MKVDTPGMKIASDTQGAYRVKGPDREGQTGRCRAPLYSLQA